MNSTCANSPPRETVWAAVVVLLAAVGFSALSARNWVGSWYDASRLATVECLVDHHTLAIDESIYVTGAPGAYEHTPRAEPGYPIGTCDKIFVNGHFYSDKSPTPAVLMAGWYQVWQWLTGWTAREQPARFMYWMTLGSNGLAFIVAVWCIFRLGLALRLPLLDRLLLTASFAGATLAPIYERQVNNHILLLGASAALFLCLARLSQAMQEGRSPWLLLLGIGTAAGLGHAIEPGAGPPLFLCTLALVAWRCWSWRAVATVALGAFPWVFLHHALNFAIGGTLRPANANPEYFTWPHSPFNATNITGVWNHATLGDFFCYAFDMMVGERGFLCFDVPMYLALGAVVLLLWRRVREWPEVLMAAAWCGGTWLLYSMLSNNYAGSCCSVRWFVPLIAPGYYVMAVLLRYQPSYRMDLLLLSVLGGLLAARYWFYGPWGVFHTHYFWAIQASALLCWSVWRLFFAGTLWLGWLPVVAWPRPAFSFMGLSNAASETITGSPVRNSSAQPPRYEVIASTVWVPTPASSRTERTVSQSTEKSGELTMKP